MNALRRCLARATQALLERRHPGGHWEGRLASSPLATAVALCALSDEDGPPSPPSPPSRRAAAHAYLRQTQRPDGGWGDTEISKSNLAATLLVLCADALQSRNAECGRWSEQKRSSAAPSEMHNEKSSILPPEARRAAEAFVEKLGGLREGLQRVYGKDLTFQVPIRMSAAAAGLLDWKEVEALPFEWALAPRRLMGALGLPVVSYALPALVCVGLARHGKAPSRFGPLRALREALSRRALETALAMQPSSGGYLEAVPITAFCLLGLKAAGRGHHPVACNARRFLIESQREDASWPVEVSLSIWNTTRAVEALAEVRADGWAACGPGPGEARRRTRAWLLARQVRSPSPYTGTPPGGWGWNERPGSVPDADDTAGALLALRTLGLPASEAPLQEGKRWLLSLQNRDGGWATFCRGWQKLPFDRSAPDLTAHALRALHALNETAHPAYRKGWAYLRRAQRADGSFAPLWFGCEQAPDECNATYGTANVLLACLGGSPQAERLRARALAWLAKIQNPDGGFGGAAGAPSSAEETGLALRALAVHGATLRDAPCQRAARWLIEHQRADGSWDPSPIGFYFAVLWYYEELYPLCHAVGALGALEASTERRAARPKAVIENATAEAGMRR